MFKFQSVVAPNGLIIELWGPHAGRLADSNMLDESKLLDRMEALSQMVRNGDVYHLYGDAAYPIGTYIMRGFKGTRTAEERLLTMWVNSFRVSVEQAFGLVLRDCRFEVV